MNGFLKFIPYNQSQDLLLPVNVQDCVPENHVARTVSLIIDFLDMSALILSYDYEGAPLYHPRMMLKVVIYTYIIGIRSSLKN